PRQILSHRAVAVSATAAYYTLSLHDALPISVWGPVQEGVDFPWNGAGESELGRSARVPAMDSDLEVRPTSETEGDPTAARSEGLDRKSTRLNSSHVKISYAVFCLKKKINTLP